jgi:molybdenum cofactor cytidylyltransferase/nicotine blue oxidoreductase
LIGFFKVISDVFAKKDMVCRAYIDEHPDEIRVMQTRNQAFVMDVDTTEDI